MGLTPVFSQELTSSVYECRFQKSSNSAISILMKDYFDPQGGQRMGKVDDTITKVYQIPLWDQQIYMQIWHAPDLRVDAQFSLSGSNKYFMARYHKGALQQDLFCTTLN